MPIANYYDVLEVSPKASAEVIRAAYKSLMQRHHPDKSANGDASTQLASSLAQAYEVLSDPQQRLAYDQTLLTQQAVPAHRPRHAGGATASMTVPRTGAIAKSRLSAWYAPVLILSIICAGGTILVLSKKKPSGGAPPQQTTQPNVNSISITDEGQVRTISGFVTDLSVELIADTKQSSAVHILHIPTFSLRLAISEPDRWTHRIHAQRQAIIQQLLVALASANYLELIKPDGDLYLKRLIEESVISVTGLDKSNALPAVDPSKKAPQPVVALLPVSYSVR
ncbi:MAG: J domain-containing protein [Pseudomonadota bacterium]